MGATILALPAIEPEVVIHPVYLPFTPAQLRRHYTSALKADQCITAFMQSAKAYTDFCAGFPSRDGASCNFMQGPCQIEKDEGFWTAACWLSLFHRATKEPVMKLLKNCFGAQPPMLDGLYSWESCLDGELELFFEVTLPAPVDYVRWCRQNIANRQFIPYLLNAARSPYSRIEGSTHCDVIFLNRSNGFSIVTVPKVLADVDYEVTYDCMRNQIARTLDVMLEPNPRLIAPLRLRNPARTLFLLQTPEIFRQNPQTRLYGWVLNAYRHDPSALARDLGHRMHTDFAALSKRIGWITWEDCNRVLPGCCGWLPGSGCHTPAYQ